MSIATSIPTKFPPPCFTISPATCIDTIIDVIPTIDNVIGKEEIPNLAHCSIISLKLVLKDLIPLKNSTK